MVVLDIDGLSFVTFLNSEILFNFNRHVNYGAIEVRNVMGGDMDLQYR